MAPFRPVGEKARWRQVDEFVDKNKKPGELITFREIQDLLDVRRSVAINVIFQVKIQREKAGKPTLVNQRGAGWLLARPDQELDEDARRHERLLANVAGRVRILGSMQTRRTELTPEQQRTLDFRTSQAAAQATVLGSRKSSAAEILGMGGGQPAVPITAPRQRADDES